MSAKSLIMLVVLFSLSMVLVCSCNDESLIGVLHQAQDNNFDAREYGSEKADIDAYNEMLYLFAFNEEGDVLSLKVYDSVYSIDFSIPIQQLEMLEVNGIAAITDHDLISGVVCGLSFDRSLMGVNNIAMLVIYSHDLDDIPWHCIKVCANAEKRESCIITCMGKKPKKQ